MFMTSSSSGITRFLPALFPAASDTAKNERHKLSGKFRASQKAIQLRRLVVTGCERSKYGGALQASDFPSGYVAVHSFFRGYQTAGPAQHLRRDFQRLPECSAFASLIRGSVRGCFHYQLTFHS